MTQTSIKDRAFRPDIEALRGIAVMLVVGYHAGSSWFRGGYVGVDVFFVLSGYLITGILTSEKAVGLAEFYGRRVKRLLPAAVTTLVVTIGVAYFVFPPVEQEGLAETALTTALYSSNIYFAQTATHYLVAPPETNPLLHTWTLSAEEQFYLGFPLLLLLTAYYLRNRVGLVLSIVTVTSFALCVYLTYVDQPKAFFFSITRAWEFALGGIGILLNRRFGRGALGAGLFGLFLILFSTIAFGDISFPGFAVLIPVLGAFLVITSSNGLEAVPGSAILQFLGKLSYSWYLWHWPVFVFARALYPEFTRSVRVSCIVLSLLLAYLSFRLVEDPIRRKQMSAKKAIGMGFALMLVGCVASLVLWDRSQDQFERVKQLPAVFHECAVGLTESNIRECFAGGDGEDVVLLGDSHAMQWYAPIEALANQRNWRLTTMFKSACGPVDVPMFSPPLGRVVGECTEWRQNVFARIRETKPKLVIMSGFQRAAFTIPALRVSFEEWSAGLERTFTELKGFNLVYIKDTPHPTLNMLNCLARNEWRSNWFSPEPCEFYEDPELRLKLDTLEREIADRHGVRYIDMNDAICPRSPCPAVVDGTVVYRDHDHITTEFSMKLLPALSDGIP